MLTYQPRLKQTPNSGFALVVALSLMAFVLLLLISMTTLVQVETESAQGTKATEQAQQNALLALNIAIGELQQLTGPDQRVTAPADLDNGDDPTTTTTEQPNWVGVWGNSSVANYTQTPDAIKPSEPVLLNWLVSGNEAVTHTTNTGSANFGQIQTATDPDDIDYKPTDANSGLASATVFTPLTIGGQDAQLLVGPNTTNDTNAVEDYVVAPLVDIETGQGRTGRYAWWVGDEGVKAKINLRPSYLDQDSSDQAEYQNYSHLIAQRTALEFVEYDDSGNRLDTEFDFTDPKLERIRDLAAVPFLGDGSSTNFESIVTERFHELTTYSHGVLADAYAGGLKKDLTSDFGGSSDRPIDDEAIFTPLSSDDKVPTWGQARSLVNASISGNVGNFSSAPILPSDSSNGVYPVFTAASLGVDFYLSGPVIDPVDESIAHYELKVAFVPLVVLWNPHTVAINAHTYELGMRIHEGNSNQAKVWVDIDGAQADVFDLYTGTWDSSTQDTENFLRFELETDDFAPGESHIYSLETNGSIYNPGVSRMMISDPGVNNYLNHVTTSTDNLQIPANSIFSPRRRTYIYSPPDIDVEVFSQRGSGTHPQSFDVVLAENGRLFNLTDQSGWYHAVLDSRLGNRGENQSDSRSPSGTVNNWLIKGPSGQYDDLDELVLDPSEVSGLNMSVFRIYNVMERRGGVAVNGNRLGQMSWSNQSTAGRTRWLITGNPRARFVKNSEVENDKIIRGSVIFASNHDVWDQPPMGDSDLFPHVSADNGNRLSVGRIISESKSNYGVAPLFDQLQSTEQFLSLGQLQHSITGPYGFNQSYPFGNSWADVRIDRDQTHIANRVTPPYGSNSSETLYDLSWHINRAVWDKYFASSVPDDWTAADITDGRPLPNSRMSYYEEPTLASIQGSDAYDEAASNMWINGAFNVNSTSEQAWRALLSATFGIPDSGDGSFADSGDNVSEIAPIPRFASNQSQTGHDGADFTNSMQGRLTSGQTSLNYIGNRGLAMRYNGTYNVEPGDIHELIDELARTIVDEVKLRGPFLSLGDFVNRAIIAENAQSSRESDWGVDPETDIGIKGALQAAIDKMGMDENGEFTTGAPLLNSRDWLDDHGPKDTDDAWVMMENEWNFEHYLGGPNRGRDNQFKMPQTVSAVGSPSCMSAADLLTVLGPAISARTDTFRIRTYGETVNPVTQETEGRAWCEAIVQRLPNYVDESDEPDIEPVSLSSASNIRFGRKYKILSLRWLDASEI